MRRAAMRAAAISAVLILILSMTGPLAVEHPVVHQTTSPPPATAITAPPASPAPLLARDRYVADHPHILSWTLLDVADGAVLAEHRCVGCTNPAASTVKVWLAGDNLHRAGDHPTLGLLRDVDAAVLDSDNTAATRLFHAAGGRAGLWRMVYTCHLIRTLPSEHWGETLITSSDLAMLGVCVAHGDVAGPTWTPWLLGRMRAVRGTGRFGPVDSLPDADVAMKNGWILNDGQWIVNCLAVVDLSWSLGVLTRYPAELGLAHGAQLCADVAAQLATPAEPWPAAHYW